MFFFDFYNQTYKIYLICFFFWAIAGQYSKHRSRHRAVRGFRPDYRQGQPPFHSGSTTIPIAIAEALAKAIRGAFHYFAFPILCL